MEPVAFQIRLEDFDLDLLPIDRELLKKKPEMLGAAVQEWFRGQFQKIGGAGDVSVSEGRVAVVWTPDAAEDGDAFLGQIIGLLNRGAYDMAGPILASLSESFPKSSDVHFNYGMMLSNQGRLDEAVRHLRQAVNLGSDSVNAWTALGVALHRQGNEVGALDAFGHALELDPENAHALRSYGGLLAKTDPAKGLPYLKKAADLLPDDQPTLYGYAQALAATGDAKEADRVLRRVIEVAPYSQGADLARELLTRLAGQSLKDRAGGGLQMDAVFFLAAALEKLDELGPEKFQAVTLEIGMLGTKGLDVRSPERKYTLKSLPGTFGGLELVCYMYVGFEHLAPGTEQGIDLAREYAAALALRGKGAGGEERH